MSKQKAKEPKAKECPEGKVLNPATGRCIKEKSKGPAAKDTEKKQETKEPKTKVIPKAKECPEGKVLNPATGRCIKEKSKGPAAKDTEKKQKTQEPKTKVIPKAKECPEGKVLNPATGRCVQGNKVKEGTGTGKGKAKEKVVRTVNANEHASSLFNPKWECQYFSKDVKSHMLELNSKVLDHIVILHDKWVKGADVYALMEANYLIDFYCTHVVFACQSSDTKKTRILWEENMITYDQLIKNLKYSEGLEKAKDLMKSFVKDIANDIKKYLSTAMNKKNVPFQKHGGIITFDWYKVIQVMNTQTLTQFIRQRLEYIQHYYASGWGMYRLINMKYFAAGERYINGVRPCSCICNSLMSITVLAALGFPREHIYVEGQKPPHTSRDKQTHWAMACVDPLTKSLNNIGHHDQLHVVFNKKVETSKAFAVYTRDIIHFYDRIALTHYESVENALGKKIILSHLREQYDVRFNDIVHEIKTAA